MAGLVFGVDIGVIAQAKEFIRQDLHLNDAVVSWIVGSMMFGALFGSLSAGMITGKIGRKNSMILSAARGPDLQPHNRRILHRCCRLRLPALSVGSGTEINPRHHDLRLSADDYRRDPDLLHLQQYHTVHDLYSGQHRPVL